MKIPQLQYSNLIKLAERTRDQLVMRGDLHIFERNTAKPEEIFEAVNILLSDTNYKLAGCWDGSNYHLALYNKRKKTLQLQKPRKKKLSN